MVNGFNVLVVVKEEIPSNVLSDGNFVLAHNLSEPITPGRPDNAQELRCIGSQKVWIQVDELLRPLKEFGPPKAIVLLQIVQIRLGVQRWNCQILESGALEGELGPACLSKLSLLLRLLSLCLWLLWLLTFSIECFRDDHSESFTTLPCQFRLLDSTSHLIVTAEFLIRVVLQPPPPSLVQEIRVVHLFGLSLVHRGLGPSDVVPDKGPTEFHKAFLPRLWVPWSGLEVREGLMRRKGEPAIHDILVCRR